MASFLRCAGNTPRYDSRKSKIVGIRMSFGNDRFAQKLVKSEKLVEKFIEYPREEDINLENNTCLVRVGYMNDSSDEDMNESYDEVDTNEIGNIYPKKMHSFLLNKKLLFPKMDQFIQKTCIAPILSKPVDSLLFLRYPLSTATVDRVVILTRHDPPTKYVLSFMNEYIPKYIVKHVKYENGQWIIMQQLSDGTAITNGGKGHVSDSDVEVICIDANAIDSHMQFKLFVLEKELSFIRNHCNANCVAYQQMITSQLVKWLRPTNSNKWKERFTFITPSGKDSEFDKMLTNNGYDLSVCTWNKAKSQQTIPFNYDQLIGTFGDDISEEIVTKHGGHYILSITKMDLTYYVKRTVDNLKIKAYVKRLAAPEIDDSEGEESENEEYEDGESDEY
eukprot:74775_1